MPITKDQRLCILLSIWLSITLVFLGLTLNAFYQDQQLAQDLEIKNIRILELEKSLENLPEIIPSNNALEYLQTCGQGHITHIDKTKNLTCELHCTFLELLNFLEKYNAHPEKIQTLHLIRNNGLAVSLTLILHKEESTCEL